VVQVSLVRNRLPEHDHSSDSDTEASPTQQQQQQSLEILDFKVHAAAGYMAVAVRRQGVCAVDIYKLRSSSSSSIGHLPAPGSDAVSPADSEAAEVTVPAVLLVTNSSSSTSSSSSSNTPTAAAVQPSSITVPNSAGAAGLAELAWVLVLDDPTLVLDLQGLEGPADEPWLVVAVSGITTPSTLYYVQLHTQQQVKVTVLTVCGVLAECRTVSSC
jgi:hypothetical protein